MLELDIGNLIGVGITVSIASFVAFQVWRYTKSISLSGLIFLCTLVGLIPIRIIPLEWSVLGILTTVAVIVVIEVSQIWLGETSGTR